jgi:uncharacterized protein
MSIEKTHISIPKNVASNNDLDYSFLKQKGLEYIKQLSSDLWTDYNTHDPGITILEMLCYAITDLGMRIDMPIENLLAPEISTAQKIEKQFIKATEILPVKPVSELDYRKLFIDIDGVKNCWLKPFSKTVYVDCQNDKLAFYLNQFEKIPAKLQSFNLQGLYTVLVDLSDNNITTEHFNELKNQIIKRFNDNRNLCEDLAEVKIVETQPISVCYIIEVYPDANEEWVQAKVLRAIDNYFLPGVKFYSLKQMFDKGFTSDSIFEGPVLTHGFIDENELKKANLQTEVRLSDIVQLIMKVEGVKYIKEISISNCSVGDSKTDIWRICIEEGKKPVRCERSTYSYYKGVLPLNINDEKVKEYIEELKNEEEKDKDKAGLNMEIEIPTGNYLNTSETTTIQNDFPDTYGISPLGLPSQVETARKSKAKQLKGYLLFFDQILASYFAHLGKVKDLLSVDNKQNQTYFTQAVADILNFDELVSDYPVSDPEELTNLLFSDLDKYVERKNRLLDHLLARFAEKFNEYAFLMKQFYGDKTDLEVIKTKKNFLNTYRVLGTERGAAFNYHLPIENLWNTENVSTVEKRIALLMGMTNFSRRDLSNDPVEVYQEKDDDEVIEYRWRIKDPDKNILCSSSKKYYSLEKMNKEILLVKALATDLNNYEIKKDKSSKYYYNLIDPTVPKIDDEDHIIARRLVYFDTKDAAQNAIHYFISFMKEAKSNEGMYLIEHILLRPDETKNYPISTDLFMPVNTDNCESCAPLDPYSFRVTVIMPGWTERFSSIDFRNFMDDLIRKELPAHVLARICWIGYPEGSVPEVKNDMFQLEKAWKAFLFSINNPDQNMQTLIDINTILSKLYSIYPYGSLYNCNDETENLKGKIILGRTNLGNI